MSRIGKLPITIPENVDVNYNSTQITVKGKFGTLTTELPDVIDLSQENKTLKVTIKEETKELLGLFASNIRSWRQPEPYKGKGILYKDEQIIRKAGKSAK